MAAGTDEVDLFFQDGEGDFPPVRLVAKLAGNDVHSIAVSHAETAARGVAPYQVGVGGSFEHHGALTCVDLSYLETRHHPAIESAGPEDNVGNES